MFTSLLIANRGEISRRIQRTARRMGLRTIAVFSDADAEAAFVREADEAVRIGPPPAAESYLRGDAILEAALETGAEAIHPGYGFLSENAAFAQAVARAGLIWIGPPPEAIRAMGLKDAAKALMQKHGVPVTPGYHGEDQSPKKLKAEAKAIGYPVLIKAVAGGGGRGMRRVDGAADFDAALASAQREAKASFGDDRVLVEKFIENPRHIEVQVFGDSHGNVVHFYERDCSLQRRRQKVIEEAPAPGMTEDVREALTSAAIAAAKAVGYQNAGTVEFIADGSGALRPDGFWFMEMNTRLQVEHPVSELVTGYDFVELQLHVANGGRLPAQSDIELSGHAVEARLCAEDPSRGFMPSSGRLEVFDLSAFNEEDGPAQLRLDSAVEQGDVVPPTYDSMIAKCIAHASTRDGAFEALAAALSISEIHPLATNAAMLISLLRHPVVLSGEATTALVEAELDDLAGLTDDVLTDILIAGAFGLNQPTGDEADPWSQVDGFRVNASTRANSVFQAGDRAIAVTLRSSDGPLMAEVEGETREVDLSATVFEDRVIVGGSVDGVDIVGAIRETDTGPVIFVEGRAIPLSPPVYGQGLDGAEVRDDIRSPMPGKILDVKVKAGAEVAKGDALVVMEAMKMEHTLTAPRAGRIAEVTAVAGQQTVEGAVLVRLEPRPENQEPTS
jgi:acetyl/propionyl-CoA carboxylase alpha subunit